MPAQNKVNRCVASLLRAGLQIRKKGSEKAREPEKFRKGKVKQRKGKKGRDRREN